MIVAGDITGLILCGGRGSRMGGVDKGLQAWRGGTLVGHATKRLHDQVGTVAINANRHLDDYRASGCPVWPDADDQFAGPLAGVLAGLDRCTTPWLLTVPCDAPFFPLDLGPCLAQAIEADVDLAIARSSEGRLQPVFCLLSIRLKDGLRDYLREGGRKVEDWVMQQRCAVVDFPDESAFANVNTLEDLRRLSAQA